MNLVTGANGFIGRHLTQPGDRQLVREPSTLSGCVAGDLLVPATLESACVGVDCVFHCAGHAHAFNATDEQVHWQVNFQGTRNLVEAAIKKGVRKFVFLSTVKAMAEPGEDCADENWPGTPLSAYGKAKRAAEEIVLEAGAKHGMHMVVLRPALVYGSGNRGNLARMARGIAAGWFPPLPDTGNQRSLVHVSDLVEVMRLTAQAPVAAGKIYIVADSRTYSGRDIYDTICRGLGKRPPAIRAPEGLWRAAGRLGDLIEENLNRSFPFTSEVVARLLDCECYSSKRLERDLNWKARVSLMEGVLEMLNNGTGDMHPG